MSNSDEVLLELPHKEVSNIKEIGQQEANTKVLGMWWDSHSDELKYKCLKLVNKSCLEENSQPSEPY